MELLNPPVLDAVLPAQVKTVDNILKLNIPIQHNPSVPKDKVASIVIRIFSVVNGFSCGELELLNSNYEFDFDISELKLDISLEGTELNTQLSIGSYYKLQIAYKDEDTTDLAKLRYSTMAVFKLTAPGDVKRVDLADKEPGSNCYKVKLQYTNDDKTEIPYAVYWDGPNTITTPYRENIVYLFPMLYPNELTNYRSCTVNTINQLSITNNPKRKQSLKPGSITGQVLPILNQERTALTIKCNKGPVLWYRKWSPTEQGYAYMGLLDSGTIITDYSVPNIMDDIFIDANVNKNGEQTGYYGTQYRQFKRSVNYEHMSLCDKNKQLCLKYDPKIQSMKYVTQESKIQSLGSRYPIIQQNGASYYREFQISATISYFMDEGQTFMTDEDLFDKKQYYSERDTTNTNEDPVFFPLRTSNLTPENIEAERRFRDQVLRWLTNGEVKLFKSPTEGLMLVKLMNVSLTPNDTLGRMIYSFSATAYEVADFNHKNLIRYNIINLQLDDDENEVVVV